jgi:Nif-specific regulatory protein
MICEKEYLCWPRVKSMPGPKHTANEQVIGYSSWIEDVRKKIDKFHGEKGPVVIHGTTGTEKYSVVKEIQDQEEKLVNDPLVIVFDEVGAIFSTLQSGERPFIDNKAIPGQINLLEMLASRPVVLRDIEKADHYIQYILSCILKDKPWEQPDNNLYRLYILVDDRNQLQTDLKNILQFFELSVQLPALNQRQEDIPYLINYYLEKYNQQYKKQKEISETAINKLIDYNWPGNIQELEKRIEWLVRNVNGEKIMPGNIDLGHTGQMGR